MRRRFRRTVWCHVAPALGPCLTMSQMMPGLTQGNSPRGDHPCWVCPSAVRVTGIYRIYQPLRKDGKAQSKMTFAAFWGYPIDVSKISMVPFHAFLGCCGWSSNCTGLPRKMTRPERPRLASLQKWCSSATLSDVEQLESWKSLGETSNSHPGNSVIDLNLTGSAMVNILRMNCRDDPLTHTYSIEKSSPQRDSTQFFHVNYMMFPYPWFHNFSIWQAGLRRSSWWMHDTWYICGNSSTIGRSFKPKTIGRFPHPSKRWP